MPKATKKKKKTKVIRRKARRRKEKYGGDKHAVFSEEARDEICGSE